ncbi:methionyl-tRNA formyltransferase [Blattabacterium cuenoti]|uniref:methionyl-tRNA formyltransferase n=1 Tax=Blattabacterium cuenoti TaxID=1653831 RepID=UPI001EEC89FE|nr:methionyl-tRNA formyltransferase [Blattabacterium cuenoti]
MIEYKNLKIKKYPRIVFIGGTSFSIFSLKQLHMLKYNIIGIITNPDKYIKNQNLVFNKIKQYAIKNKIPILQPTNLIDTAFIETLKSWNIDLQIVVSFRILPKQIWNLPKIGTLNLHASILPNYKGPFPIHWSILNGETQTGLTTFFIKNDDIDSGNIILQNKINIGQNETYGEVENKLKQISGNVIIKTLHEVITKKEINNKHFTYTTTTYYKSFFYARKIYNEDCRIKWQTSCVDVIHNQIRGLSPYPTAWTYLFIKNKFYRFKIFLSKKILSTHLFPLGLVTISAFEMKISAIKGFISIIEGQLEGRKKMFIKNIINGIKIKTNIFVK